MRITSGIWLGLGVLFMGSVVMASNGPDPRVIATSCLLPNPLLHDISFGRIQEGPSTVCRTQRRRAGAVFGVNPACFFKIHKGAVNNERGESGCGIRGSRHGG
jgi:hypothetical protein